jgi:hypothetical protein
VNYTDLKANIADICENEFTADQYAMFAKQAEQKIHNTVFFPALRRDQTGTLTASNAYLSVPTDMNYVNSLAIISATGAYTYLTQVEPSFIREAYPNPATEGTPKHYAHFDVDSFVVGPTPDTGLSVQLSYGYYPESIVTASTTWLGDHFDTALLNGALVEAIRFLKGEEDMVAFYQSEYMQSLALLKQLGEGRMGQDSYAAGQPRSGVS